MAFFRRKNNDPLDPQNLAEHLRLDAQPVEPKPVEVGSDLAGFRLTVQDVFQITGRGTVVTGQVEAGSITKGASVILTRVAGGSRTVTVDSIEVGRKIVPGATLGDNAGLLLGGVTRSEVSAGDVLRTS